VATRLLVIGLVIVNIVFVGIRLSNPSVSNSRAEPVESASTGSDTSTIYLLAELPSNDRNSSGRADPCFTVGPLQSSSEMQVLKSALVQHIGRFRERVSTAQVGQGFWVYVAAPESRAASQEIVAQLASLGVRDYYVLPDGDMENSISLGIYNIERNARKRQDAMRALGFDARLQARYRSIEQYWLDYELIREAAPGWLDLQSTLPGAKRLEIPCSNELFGIVPPVQVVSRN